MKQIVKPIKDSNVLEQVKNYFLERFDTGRRNYTIFQVGKALRVSYVLRLKKSDVYDQSWSSKEKCIYRREETKKHNVLYLHQIKRNLEDYYDWLEQYELKHPGQAFFQSEWLFPSMSRPEKHIDERSII